MKICIGISSGEYIKSKTVATVFSLIKKYPYVDLIIKQSCLIHKNRNDIIEEAIKKDYTHILFLDSDMCFAPQLLERLLSRDKDIIGVNYFRRNINKETTVRFIENRQIVMKDIPETLFECDGLGAGCMLVKTEVFKDLKNPYFNFDNDIGEDINFCLQAKNKGYKIWCDPTIDVGHIGEMVF